MDAARTDHPLATLRLIGPELDAMVVKCRDRFFALAAEPGFDARASNWRDNLSTLADEPQFGAFAAALRALLIEHSSDRLTRALLQLEMEANPRQAAMELVERRLGPDLARGRKVRRSAAEGGKARRKAPPDHVLCREVQGFHEQYPDLSWTYVCTLIGRRHGLNRRTIQRRTEPIRW